MQPPAHSQFAWEDAVRGCAPRAKQRGRARRRHRPAPAAQRRTRSPSGSPAPTEPSRASYLVLEARPAGGARRKGARSVQVREEAFPRASCGARELAGRGLRVRDLPGALLGAAVGPSGGLRESDPVGGGDGARLRVPLHSRTPARPGR